MNLNRVSLLVALFFILTLSTGLVVEAREYKPLVIDVAAYSSEPGTVSYEVKKGDTLYSISRRFDVELGLITALNHITDANRVKVGQEILIPVNLEFHTPVVVTTTTVNNRNVSIQSVGNRLSSRTNNGFMAVPTTGVITSLFGPRNGEFHTGLDLANNQGTTIYSAQEGKVVFTGWRGNYGRTVIIDHMNGYKTLYGHNNKVTVKVGQWVKAGDPIAQMGNTGRSTGPHLHFEVYRDNQVVNPLEYIGR